MRRAALFAFAGIFLFSFSPVAVAESEAVFQKRMERLETQLARQEFKQARFDEVRRFCRSCIDKNFDDFFATLDSGTQADLQALIGSNPINLPPEVKKIAMENYSRLYLGILNGKNDLKLRDVQLLDLDLKASDPVLGAISVKMSFRGKPIGASFRLIERDGNWKIDLGLHERIAGFKQEGERYREARFSEARSFCRFIAFEDFDAFLASLDKDSRENVLSSCRSLRPSEQSPSAQTKKSFSKAFRRFLALRLQDLDSLTFDLKLLTDPEKITDSSVPKVIEVKPLLAGKEIGAIFRLHEETAGWKVELGKEEIEKLISDLKK